MTNFFKWFGRQMDDGWFSRSLLLLQFFFVWKTLDWSMAFASTALAGAIQGHTDILVGAATNIGAVFVGPQALLMLATSKYMEMRAQQPRVMQDRRTA